MKKNARYQIGFAYLSSIPSRGEQWRPIFRADSLQDGRFFTAVRGVRMSPDYKYLIVQADGERLSPEDFLERHGQS